MVSATRRLPERWRGRVAAVRDDHTSGATGLTQAAAMAFTELGDWLVDVAADLAPATAAALIRQASQQMAVTQPTMASLRRLGWAVATATARAAAQGSDTARVGATIRSVAESFVAALQVHQARAAAHAAVLLPRGACVLTHSASSAVEAALIRAWATGRLARALCLESRPLCEGQALAGRLAAAGVPTTLAVDAAAARLVAHADAVLVGGDTVAPGGLVNKTGTAALALVARACRVPIYAVCTTEKLLPRLPRVRRTKTGRRGFAVADRPQPAAEVVSPPLPGVTVCNHYFDRTPLRLLTAVVTEDGPLPAAEVRRRAGALAITT